MENDMEKINNPAVENERVEKEILRNLVYYKLNPDEIPNRINEIDNEWDIEKTFERNASVIGLAGVLFSILFGKKWLFLSLVSSGFLLQHALEGWSPPLSGLRRLGFRTRKEIDTERQSLKILKGDYDDISSGEENDPAATLEKVKGSPRIKTEEPLTTSGFPKRRRTKISEEE